MRDIEERRRRVRELLDVVQLPAAYLNRFPHAFSAGSASASASLGRWRSTRR
jgi:ABC-type oligopeptide transport system ATPase subunit